MLQDQNKPLVSICIPTHNMGHLLDDAVRSAYLQTYTNKEIIVFDDASTDETIHCQSIKWPKVHYFKSQQPSGTGEAFNKAMFHASGDIIVLLCADDIFTNRYVVSDIVNEFKKSDVVHVTRYYHQFVGQDRRPVRAWRCNNIIELANNPSGLAFRKSALKASYIRPRPHMTNKMFVESATLVYQVMLNNPQGKAVIIPYDTVAVRIHKSTSQRPDYYLKMWTSSPVLEWSKIGGSSLQKDYTALIQIKNNFVIKAVISEAINYIRLRPINVLMPHFWGFFLIALITPRKILKRIPELYRKTIGLWTTQEVKRDAVK